MRVPRVRFTVRGLMVVVAIATVFLAAWVEIARRGGDSHALRVLVRCV
jgi:hypothetical protein